MTTPLSSANALVLAIPDFIDETVRSYPGSLADDAGRMKLATVLAAQNVARGGGPFGALVFEGERLVSGGVNLVLSLGYSIAHAEIVALMRAQQALAAEAVEKVDPNAPRTLTLVTSAEPCCQCFGAIVWSGVGRLVCGATREDVESVGFDEGPKPASWISELTARGIGVQQEVEREEARRVLADYARRGGAIYGRGRK